MRCIFGLNFLKTQFGAVFAAAAVKKSIAGKFDETILGSITNCVPEEPVFAFLLSPSTPVADDADSSAAPAPVSAVAPSSTPFIGVIDGYVMGEFSRPEGNVCRQACLSSSSINVATETSLVSSPCVLRTDRLEIPYGLERQFPSVRLFTQHFPSFFGFRNCHNVCFNNQFLPSRIVSDVSFQSAALQDPAGHLEEEEIGSRTSARGISSGVSGYGDFSSSGRGHIGGGGGDSSAAPFAIFSASTGIASTSGGPVWPPPSFPFPAFF